MRHLVLLHGPQAAGKSSFIEQNKLEPYTLSYDKIRLLFSSPLLTVDGGLEINNANNKLMVDTLMTALEERMKKGHFTIVDATHVRTSEVNGYQKLVDEYRYRVWLVDFTCPIEVAKERNKNREPYKRLPEDALDKYYARLKDFKVPGKITVIKPEEFFQTFKTEPLDFSEYKKIHHIGDLQGCNTVLQEYLKDGLKDDELYIFIGDYCDRGIENGEVVKFMTTILNKRNVILLEGNHEIHLHRWSQDYSCYSDEFRFGTMPELESKGVLKSEASKLYRKTCQMAYYKYHEKVVLATHGGLSYIPEYLAFVPAIQIMKGVGGYDDVQAVNDAFVRNTPPNYYQIHGHRNVQDLPVQVNERCFVLEGKVEFGGNRRVVTLDKDGFKPVEVQNKVFKGADRGWAVSNHKFNNLPMLLDLRKNHNIQEKKLEYNISSFNFNRKVFNEGLWDTQTIKARGLFMNTETTEIVIRSYNKFWNIGEREDTQLGALKYRLKFPVTISLKENGFLGLSGYDSQADCLVLASKTSTHSPFANLFKDLFYKNVKDKNFNGVKEYLRENNCSMVFEVIDPKNDPHIIEYEKDDLVLLDIVMRTAHYEKLPYAKVKEAADTFGFNCRKNYYMLSNWEAFEAWYAKTQEPDFTLNGVHVEGFVVEDSAGYMTKVKLPFYNTWKYLRSLRDMVNRPNFNIDDNRITEGLAKDFVNWMRSLSKSEKEKDIVYLRKKFLADYRKDDTFKVNIFNSVKEGNLS